VSQLWKKILFALGPLIYPIPSLAQASGSVIRFFIQVYGGDKEKKKKKKNSTNELYSLITERLAEVDLEKVLSGEDEAGAKEINQLGKYKPVQSGD